MRPFYYSTTTNFGDFMNSWLWPRVIPELVAREDDIRLIGIGSLLKSDISRIAGRKIIFGSGSGYGDVPPRDITREWRFYCVRGPLTARNFGLDTSLAIVDAAWLINQLDEFRDPPTRKSGTVFVPHWTSAAYGDWAPACTTAGLSYIDPLDDSVSVISRIAQAELAIVESLHGAIIADYYRTPWIPVASSGRILHFKWLDWCMSIDAPYGSIALPPSDFVDFLVQRRQPRRGPFPVVESRFSADAFPFREVAAPAEAGSGYRLRQRAKSRARAVREVVLNQMRGVRDSAPLRAWNAAHREALAAYFDEVRRRPGQLSADAVRGRRIDQLNEALERLRRDHAA